ncbi:hypothetical protein [Silvimonas soli]|uniref:hypothetical protein n=1 Tax=Silvimonas soli TaxID=2980100 RepID=UPI0024B3896E|nr:hypothetical protein [Silvimonas soli]
MTVISSLSNTNPNLLSAGTLTSAGSVSTTDNLANAAAQPTPSAVVTLGNVSGSVQTYSAQGTVAFAQQTITTWKTDSKDAVSLLMAHNDQASSLSQRLKGLGAAVLNAFKTGSGNYSQSVTRASAAGMALSSSNGVRADTELRIKTASGVLVKITLASQDSGLAVDIQSDGKLSDQERTAIAGLADGFQDALDGLAKVPPSLNLAGMAGYDNRVLASVDLQTAVRQGQQPTSVALHLDNKVRALNVSNEQGKLQLNVNTGNSLIQGTAAQRAASINSFLQQVDAAAARGHGDATLVSMFKDAFVQLNNDTASAGTSYTQPLNARDHAMLTGLADFQASITDTPRSVNPMRPAEVDSFNWSASQSTSIGGKTALDRTITQTQQARLTASYHRPLTGTRLDLTSDRKSQNYYYDQIDDVAQSKANITYQDGKLTSATLDQSASQTTHETKFVQGKQEEDKTMPVQQSQTLNLLGLLAQNDTTSTAASAQSDAANAPNLVKAHGLILLHTSPNDLRAASH